MRFVQAIVVLKSVIIGLGMTFMANRNAVIDIINKFREPKYILSVMRFKLVGFSAKNTLSTISRKHGSTPCFIFPPLFSEFFLGIFRTNRHSFCRSYLVSNFRRHFSPSLYIFCIAISATENSTRPTGKFSSAIHALLFPTAPQVVPFPTRPSWAFCGLFFNPYEAAFKTLTLPGVECVFSFREIFSATRTGHCNIF